MASRITVAALLGIALIGVSCAERGANTVPARTPPPATSSATLAPATTDVPPEIPPASTGLGDPYFPAAGNGGYDVQHYVIDLDVDVSTGGMRPGSSATIEAVATGDLAAFSLDLVGMRVRSVTVDGARAAFLRDGSELIVVPADPIPTGDRFVTAVGYDGRPEPARSGGLPIPVGWRTGPFGVVVFSEPDGARSWFPGNDHPADKATFTFRVTVAEPFVVAANGRLTDVVDRGERTTYVWEAAQPMATYLATVDIGIYERVEREGLPGVELRSYYPPDMARDIPEAFEKTADVLTFLANRFGPYPFDSYGEIVVDGFEVAAEAQTLSIFARGIATADFLESVVVHEAAHQWFGNSVSPATWQDVWLNEGFATYAEWLWSEQQLGRAAYDAEVQAAYDAVTIGRYPPPGDPGPDRLFTPSIYLRGALTLHALREVVGADALYAVMREYAARHAYGNASTADFVAVAEEVTGAALADLIEVWLYQTAVPPLP